MAFNTSFSDIAGAWSTLSNQGAKNSARAAAMQYQYNLSLQKQAQEWNEKMYKNRYTYQREDLEKAGINPLFGMGQAPSVTSGTNSIGMPDMVGEQNNKFNQMMSLLDFGQNLSAKRAQTKLIERQAETEEQNTLLRTAEVLRENINNEWLPKEKKAELENKLADTMDKLASVNERKAKTSLTNAQTARENLEQAPMKRYEKWVRENPKLASFIEGSQNNKDIITGIGALIGGGALGLGALKGKFFKKKVGF